MTNVGITGHQRLSQDDAWPWVEQQMRLVLSEIKPPIVGLTALAAGADQLFARLVLERKGELEAMLPFENYDVVLSNKESRKEFIKLRDTAKVAPLRQHQPSRAKVDSVYLEASKRIVEKSEILFAVWECGRTGSVGSTHAVLAYAREFARERGRPEIIIFDPLTREVTREQATREPPR